MNSVQELEMEYAKRLRDSSHDERRGLYVEAYSAVSEKGALAIPEEREKRTAGTSPSLVNSITRLCDSADQILEVGCGRGYTCLKLAPHVASIVGIDVSEPTLNEARKLMETHQVSNVSILRGFADELTRHFGEEVFDKVISIDVHEHLHPEDALMHLLQVYSVLKPKGRFIVVTPNRLTGPHDVTRELFPDADRPLGFHLNETTCTELVQQMEEVGFVKVRAVMPISFRMPVPFDIIYPCTLFAWIEKQIPRVRRGSRMDRLVSMVSGIFLIAERG
jgi:2-polyprenyl-3-methyl-5-hydroxy-6-metoxy-1,4-benzoquinol methylase